VSRNCFKEMLQLVDELTMETRHHEYGSNWQLGTLRVLQSRVTQLYSRYQINQFYSGNSPSVSTHGKYQPDSRPKSCARDTGVRPV
jgi:hypothetical protein